MNSNQEKSILNFMHIPETTDNSIISLLMSNYNNVITYDSKLEKLIPYFEQEDNPQVILGKKITSIESSIDAIAGKHIPAGIIEQFFNKQIQNISFVRNPTTRSITNYYSELEYFNFKEKYQNSLSDYQRLFVRNFKFSNKLISLEEYLKTTTDNPLRENSHNLQTTYFSGSNTIPTKESLDKAISNIENNFLFVGLTEEYEKSILILKQKLNWSNINFLYQNNLTTNKTIATTPEYFTNLSSNKNNFDIELYNMVKENFKKEIDNYNGDIEKDVFDLKNSLNLYKKNYTFCNDKINKFNTFFKYQSKWNDLKRKNISLVPYFEKKKFSNIVLWSSKYQNCQSDEIFYELSKSFYYEFENTKVNFKFITSPHVLMNYENKYHNYKTLEYNNFLTHGVDCIVSFHSTEKNLIESKLNEIGIKIPVLLFDEILDSLSTPSVVIIYDNKSNEKYNSSSKTYASIVNQSYKNISIRMGNTTTLNSKMLNGDYVYFIEEGYVLSKDFIGKMVSKISTLNSNICITTLDKLDLNNSDNHMFEFLDFNKHKFSHTLTPSPCILYSLDFFKNNTDWTNISIHSISFFIGAGVYSDAHKACLLYNNKDYTTLIKTYSASKVPEVLYYISLSALGLDNKALFARSFSSFLALLDDNSILNSFRQNLGTNIFFTKDMIGKISNSKKLVGCFSRVIIKDSLLLEKIIQYLVSHNEKVFLKMLIPNIKI